MPCWDVTKVIYWYLLGLIQTSELSTVFGGRHPTPRGATCQRFSIGTE